MLRAGIALARQRQWPLRGRGLATGQRRLHALHIVAVGVEHPQGQGGSDRQFATCGHRAGILPLRHRRGAAAVAFKAHVHAGVERFGRIRALPGVVDHVLAAALRQRALQLVGRPSAAGCPAASRRG
ncbi:hypothetical protein G6F66_014217 [Rhizopus arrhizus]|nr:hypothetical protein G6F66_014217 [Rhizopus arrhizus]